MTQSEINGILEKIVFQSPETGFSVFVVKVNSKESVTVRGTFPSLHQGEHVNLRGRWVKHPKFGQQFEASECISKLPSSVQGIKKYLASGLIKGIGPKFAERIVEVFGENTLEIIDNNPERLHSVGGIGEKRVSLIIQAWKEQKEISRVMVFLQDKDISTGFAAKIFKTYGQESIAKIQENPYRLVEDIWGVGFKSADSVALKLGFEINSLFRIKAGILFFLSEASTDGHLYGELESIRNNTLKLLGLDDSSLALIKRALHDLFEEQKIKLLTFQDKHYLSLPKYYFSEKGVANKILRLKDHKDELKFDFEAIYKTLQKKDSRRILLNEDQQKGILTCLQNKVTIITGGPGTGKTTLLKKLLDVLEETKVRFALAAPTGRAAKRMFEGTGRNAQTLHRLLEFSPTIMDFTKNEQNALDVDYLIVDEASMIDVFLMHAILRAMPFRGRLLLIGDIDQLPSVGAGNILGDLISSGVVEVAFLKQIFRQAQDSLIIVNAHKINNGEFPISREDSSRRDFKYLEEDIPENIFGHLKKIYTVDFPRKGIDPKEAIVLCPMNRGVAGTNRINQELQMILNPQKDPDKEIMRFGQAYRVNDRVMQIRNNYDKFIFNGDIGFIEDINKIDQEIKICFGERTLTYDFSELNELVLSYAISIHKSQGSEFKVVIVSIFMQHFIMLRRNLIYTALTRAKEFCYFVGEARAIAMGIKNDKDIERNTFLNEFLTTDLEAR
ncbi:ATP-dependent RecD-like DNA helicase [Candidatus Babeliales bacterium]|nr:ATP-dependent RecD-like DNA helicase [Candidatus Babeliales bacterium]